MSDDAEFDAFLKGEGELSRLLKDMPQAEPSAALDAAILARARSAMEQEARPQAANDPGKPGAAPQLAPSMARRWRMPVGIAATMLAGLFAVKSLQPNLESQYGPIPETSVAEAPAAAAAPPMQAAPPAEAMADVQAEAEAKSAAQDEAKRAAVQEQLRASAAKSERSRMVLEERSVALKPAVPPAPPPPPPAAPAPAPVQVEAAPPVMAEPAPAAAPAPAPAAAVEKKKEYAVVARRGVAANVAADAAREERITVTGSRIAPRTPDQWIQEIGKLLRDGRKEEALEQWKLFRVAHPNARVDAALEAQLTQ